MERLCALRRTNSHSLKELWHTVHYDKEWLMTFVDFSVTYYGNLKTTCWGFKSGVFEMFLYFY